ncbi:MAG TPA: hypothetical protein DIV79_05090 [Opitutae bacterium]|nr:hypothetical protein [Opitutaceae bacterium]HCR29375.1 hypothetical protein [Opitutae bacterium]|tara:strand:- start:379 stop:981 length:603 start_codon:yes stop_codon:yes gene_type:complete
MSLRPIVFFISLALSIGASALLGQEEKKELRIGEQPLVRNEAPKNEPASIEKAKLRRTSVFDETEIRKLYKEAKTQNDKLNEGLPAHLNGEELDLVTLKTLDVGGTDIQLQRDLVERLDPKPRRRLQRIAEFDPEAAFDMMVTTRNDQEFMSGQYDRRTAAGDPGRPANFSGNQLYTAFEKAVELFRGKKGEPDSAQPAK